MKRKTEMETLWTVMSSASLTLPASASRCVGGRAGQGQEVVGEGGFLLHPSRAPAARGVEGGLCHRGGGSGSLTVPVNAGP